MYKGVGDGFRSIHAAEGMKGFTLVSNFLVAIMSLLSPFWSK